MYHYHFNKSFNNFMINIPFVDLIIMCIYECYINNLNITLHTLLLKLNNYL